MRKITDFVIFSAGLLMGSLGAWQYAKKKYEQIAQEEIDSVKQAFSAKGTVKTEKAPPKPDIFAHTENRKTGKENRSPEPRKPYVISPEEFGENEDYERFSLSYYADQVLANENDEIIEDVDDIVGVESLTHFGEYEDDSVFVRNDERRCDYEILMDQRNYSDVVRKRPRRKEV